MPLTIRTKKEAEIGKTGLEYSSGIIDEEYLSDLKDEKGRRVYTEMSNNDPIIGALLFAIEMLIRRVEWKVRPATEDEVDKKNADFLFSCMHDMSMTWPDFISEVLSMLPFGWAYHELVYKKRDDGCVGWKKIPIRGQNSFERWHLDENGGVEALEQNPAPDYRTRIIPIEKALLFRTQIRKNNPEGRSILRTAYKPWYYANHIQNYEGIGVERDLAGLPIVYAPMGWFDPESEHAPKLAALKKLVTSIRRNEKEGLVIPYVVDENGNQIIKFELLNSGGKRDFKTTEIIERHESRMLMSVLADFIMLGTKNVGSFALASSKTAMFSTAIGSWLGSIAGVLNSFAVPRLFELNAFNVSGGLPQIAHADIETVDLEVLGNFILKLAQVGVEITDEDEAYLREQANLPTVQEDEKQA